MNKFKFYTQTSHDINKLIATRYSTSFSSAMSLLDEPIRTNLYSIYGYVRVADELVDSLRPKNSQKQLDAFIAETDQALISGTSLNPVIHSFAITAKRYNIPDDLTRAFFDSMAMDIKKTKYSKAQYQKYIYGSAEVVGLMCLCVFIDGKKSKFTKLKPGARALGSAFQKVNFLRDIASDSQDLGRVYFPGVDMKKFTQDEKAKVIADIRLELAEASKVISALPHSSRYGVMLACQYYSALLRKLSKTPASQLASSRIRINNGHKAAIYCLVVTRKLLHI